jgi:hypothetical protein
LPVKNTAKPSVLRALPFKPEHQHLLTDPVFLIGNGTSRNKFDLERLRGIGTIIGCNALHREFKPDILLAIDAKMLKEIRDAEYGLDNICIVPANRNIHIPGELKWRTERFNTSGCFGMKLIAELMQPSTCYMIGMDCYPGNMYDNSPNYAKNTLQNFSGVGQFYLKALRGNGNTVFINVNDKDAWPSEAHATEKYRFMTFEDFELQVMK